MKKIIVKYMPSPYDAWGVFVFDPETRRGIVPIYFCNEDNSKEQAEYYAHNLRLLDGCKS